MQIEVGTEFVEVSRVDNVGYAYVVASITGSQVAARSPESGEFLYYFDLSEFNEDYIVPPCSCGSTALERAVVPEAGISGIYCKECGYASV